MNLIFLKSYRLRIIFSFLSIIFITLLLIFSYNYIDNKTKDLQALVMQINDIKSDFSQNNQNLQSFILFGYKKPEFYNKNIENNIDAFIENTKIQLQEVKQFKSSLESKSIHQDISTLEYQLEILAKLALDLKVIRYNLGFRDYGLIGEMRNIAHDTETKAYIKREELLQLRRHEKDFMLRADIVYVNSFNALINTIIDSYDLNNSQEDELLSYQIVFNKVVDLYIKSGNGPDSGAYGLIVSLQKKIYNNINIVEENTASEIIIKNKNIKSFSQSAAVFGVIIISFLIYYLSNILTRDLKLLQLTMHKFIASKFRDDSKEKLVANSNILEVKRLYKSYNLLKSNLLSNIDGLKLTIEELEKTTKYKSSFLANMSHEIRTPLNGITGMLAMLKQTDLNDKQKNYLEIAEYSSSHLLDLINLILDYSKINAGKMELEEIPMNIASDFNKLTKIFHFQAIDKNIDLVYNFNKESEDNFVIGDPVRLHQVIINLLNNAIKFTSYGTVTLNINQKRINDTFDEIEFMVKDTGIGMDQDQARQAFEAFEQVDLSTTRKFGGTGLGLTISYELVKLMGSELKIKSKKNICTTFYFTIRLKSAKKGNLKPLFKQNKIDITANNFLNVLVVEDNLMNQKILEIMLQKRCASINFAKNGVEGLDLYNKNDYDLIFMDLQMPIMDGYEATKMIKSTRKYINNMIPIIAVSASAYTDDKRNALEAGIDDFLSKPVELDKLNKLLIKYSFATNKETLGM